MNPSKSRREIEAEQRKHSGNCTYHLSKSCTTADCSVKKDCDKLLLDKQNGISSSSPTANLTGHLRHITDDVFEDAIAEDPVDASLADVSNDTNDNVFHMFREEAVFESFSPASGQVILGDGKTM